MKVETTEEFLARGGEITHIKPKSNSNYCPICHTWYSILSFYWTSSRQCLSCHNWIDPNNNQIDERDIKECKYNFEICGVLVSDNQ